MELWGDAKPRQRSAARLRDVWFHVFLHRMASNGDFLR